MKTLAERAGITAMFGPHRIKKGELVLLTGDRFHHAIIGGHAEFDPGYMTASRTTVTRVAAGAVIAGPVGAIVGAIAKKNDDECAAVFTFPDGTTKTLTAPRTQAKQLRAFVEQFNAQAARA